MKNPNGYGTVYRIGGKKNRRKPWAARKTEDWWIDEITGKIKRKYKIIGYYETQAEAMLALAQYNADPLSIPDDITFKEVYERWSERKYEQISASAARIYKAAYKRCEPLYNRPIRELRLQVLQELIDRQNAPHTTLTGIKTLLSQLFDYAVQHEIIGKDKHIIEYIDIGKPVKSTMHYRFTDEEIDIMWRHTDIPTIRVILMMIYSGVRPGELLDLKTASVDINNALFKIEKGKTKNAVRTVPIHSRVLPFFEELYSSDSEFFFEKQGYQKDHRVFAKAFGNALLSVGILNYTNDSSDVREHLPDDTRHTFTTRWIELKLDEPIRRKIQGHSGAGIGEQVYAHISVDSMRDELEKI